MRKILMGLLMVVLMVSLILGGCSSTPAPTTTAPTTTSAPAPITTTAVAATTTTNTAAPTTSKPPTTTTSQETITLKIAHTMTPTGDPMPNKQFQSTKFKELVEARTNGRIKVEIYPAGQLYKDPEAIAAVASGIIFGTPVGPQALTTIEPRWDIFNIWGLFQTVDQVHKFMKSAGWTELTKIFEAKGMIVTGHPNQSVNLFTPNAVTKFSDATGLKIRSAESKAELECAKATFPGNDFVVVNIADIFTAFQTGLVKATVSLPLSVQSRKLHQFVPYMLEDPAFYMSRLEFVASKIQLDKLPADLKTTVLACIYDADAATEKHELEVYSPYVVQQMLNDGLKKTKLEAGEWDKAVANLKPVYDKYKGVVGDVIWNAAMATK